VRAVALAAVLLAACVRPPQPIVVPSASPEPGVLEVSALLDLSGSRAPRGDAQRGALQLWTDIEQARGAGRVRVRLRIVDVASSDARLLVELRRAAVEDRADAVIVGVPVNFETTPGFAGAARAAELPLVLTLPVAEPVARSGGRWTFALAPTPEQIARRVVRSSTSALDTVVITAEGRPVDAEAAAILDEWRRSGQAAPQQLRVDRRDDAIQAAVRLATPGRRVHLAGPPRDWGFLGSALKQAGRGATYVLSYLTEPSDLGEFRDGLDVVWPAPLHLTLAAIPPDAAAPARRQFVQSYGDRHGAPTAHAAAAFDALTLLALAAARAGADDRERLREQLEATGFAGVAATYAFSVTRHAGHSGDDLVLYRWNGSVAVPDTRR
jgi:ABC-type branched-subunit amino acid transport system substrate-binding protein